MPPQLCEAEFCTPKPIIAVVQAAVFERKMCTADVCIVWVYECNLYAKMEIIMNNWRDKYCAVPIERLKRHVTARMRLVSCSRRDIVTVRKLRCGKFGVCCLVRRAINIYFFLFLSTHTRSTAYVLESVCFHTVDVVNCACIRRKKIINPTHISDWLRQHTSDWDLVNLFGKIFC